MGKNDSIQLFEDRAIRTAWDEGNERAVTKRFKKSFGHSPNSFFIHICKPVISASKSSGTFTSPTVFIWSAASVLRSLSPGSA